MVRTQPARRRRLPKGGRRRQQRRRTTLCVVSCHAVRSISRSVGRLVDPTEGESINWSLSHTHTYLHPLLLRHQPIQHAARPYPHRLSYRRQRRRGVAGAVGGGAGGGGGSWAGGQVDIGLPVCIWFWGSKDGCDGSSRGVAVCVCVSRQSCFVFYLSYTIHPPDALRGPVCRGGGDGQGADDRGRSICVGGVGGRDGGRCACLVWVLEAWCGEMVWGV